eukprot:2850663-Prymnesium_polylepis.1
MTSRSSSQSADVGKTRTRRPAAPAARPSAITSSTRAGWLRRSASKLRPRGTATPTHIQSQAAARRASAAMCGDPPCSSLSADTADEQSQTPYTIAGRPNSRAAALASSSCPKTSAAAVGRNGAAPAVPPRRKAASCSSADAAKAALMSGGHSSETTMAVGSPHACHA